MFRVRDELLAYDQLTAPRLSIDVRPDHHDLLLQRLHHPDDLTPLSVEDAANLANEIRWLLVASVAKSGGHLGSNLGVVELTMALHRVFRSPSDVILWDTGHQAYVHKILTGRREAFSSLRQVDGLSGYPSRRESDHDWVENSHASTILSYADGLAIAFALTAADRRVVAVVGDGSLTGGLTYEALNNIGFYRRRVIVVLNDNGRSYAPTVSRLTGASEADGTGEARAFFEALGFEYVGLVEGHDLVALQAALESARGQEGPVVVHAITEKGRGYSPALVDQEKRLHDCGPFDDIAHGPEPSGLSGYTRVFADALVDIGRRRPEVVAVTAAMPGSTGLLPFAAAFPDRFVDVGIAEPHAVTAAAGMAMGGLRPVLAIYSTFFTRAFDQANLDVALHGLPVVFVLDRAGVTGDDGPSHNGVLDLALCLKVPGMVIFAPSSAAELPVMLEEALRCEGPAVVRFPKGACREVDSGCVGRGLAARRARHGDGTICVIAVGTMLEAAEEAADLLETAGLDLTVWDPRVVVPLDEAMIDDAARSSLVVTVEDGIARGGAGSFVASAISRAACSGTPPRVVSLGTPVRFLEQGKPAGIRAALGLDGPGLASSIIEAFRLGSELRPLGGSGA